MRHNETVHKDDHEVLGLKRFTLKDLVHSCDICPLGFLTENILINHKKLKHRMEVKKSKEECKECGKVIKNYGLKKHMLTHRNGSEKRTTLNCEKCNKVVKTKNYKSHLLTHGDKQYECNLCYRMFSIPKYLWKHQKQVHVTDAHLVNKPINEEDLQFECNYCKKRFVSSNILRYHSKDHSENGHGLLTKEKKKNRSARKRLRLRCKLCYSKFKGVSNLNSHIDEAHAEDIHLVTDNIKEEDKVFGCDECELRFITENVLKYHKSKPHGGKYVRCKICSKITRRDRVEAHQRRHSGRNHTCLLCYSSFQSQDFLKKHEEKSHTSDREKDFLLNGMGDFTFSCTKCELKFLTDSLLQSHLRKHKAEALIKQRNDKFEHLKKECYNKDDKKYQCKLCYIRYKEFGSLSAHFDTVHGDEIELILKQLSESDFTLQCDVCLLKFVSKLSKDIHMSKLHDDESESNFCKLCNFEFKNSSGYWQHKIQIHKNELSAFRKTYEESDMVQKCTSCSKSFVTEASLHYHKTKEHVSSMLRANENLNTEGYCKLCDLAFRRFPRHQYRTHADEMEAFEIEYSDSDKTFQCTNCDMKYVTKASLDYHISSKHYTAWKNSQKGPVMDETYCKLCDVHFKKCIGFLQHKSKVHGKELEAFSKNYMESDLVYRCRFAKRGMLHRCLLIIMYPKDTTN